MKRGRPDNTLRPSPGWNFYSRNKNALVRLITKIAAISRSKDTDDGLSKFGTLEEEDVVNFFYHDSPAMPWPSEIRGARRQPATLPAGDSDDEFHDSRETPSCTPRISASDFE